MASKRRGKRLATIEIIVQGVTQHLSPKWNFHKIDNEKMAICQAVKNNKSFNVGGQKVKGPIREMLMAVYDMSITSDGLLLKHMTGDKTTLSLADPDSFKKIAEFIESDSTKPRESKDQTWTSTLYISDPVILKQWRNSK
jgi:hypothetical protein